MDIEKIETAINLWIQLTGKNPEIKQRIFKMDFFYKPEDIGDFEINQMNEELREAMSFDESLASFVSILRADVKDYANRTRYTLADLSDDNSEAFRKIKIYQELYRILSLASPTDEEKERKEYVIKTMKSIGREPSKKLTLSMIARMFVLAKKGIHGDLLLSQFTNGTYSKSGVHIFDHVYLCNDASELIAGLVHTPYTSCITLAFVYDRTSPQSSFFAFGIKNGENVYLLSDKPYFPNPNYANSTRCTSRSLEENMKRSRMPYSLMGFDLSDRYSIKQDLSNVKTIVPKGISGFPILGSFKDITEDEYLYVIFMISNIKQKFFTEHTEIKELSYTLAQVDTPLIASNSDICLVPYSENRIVLNPIHSVSESDTLSYQSCNDKIVNVLFCEENKKVIDHYSYLFDRYADKISISDIQPVGKGKKIPVGEQYSLMRPVNSTGFYTKSKLEYTQKWLFRQNYAVAVNTLNSQEYMSKKAVLERWFEEAVTSKKDEILLRSVHGEIVGDFADYLNTTYNDGNLIRFGDERSIVTGGRMEYGGDYDGVCFGNGRRLSCISKKTACFFIQLRCGTWKDLCSVLGISRENLPEELRHYDSIHAPMQEGNAILDNIDPLSCVFDRFNHMKFSVTYYFGKNELIKFFRNAGGDINAIKRILESK